MNVAMLLSGGVDSSVALCRLRELGYRHVTAFYLKIWLEDELAHIGECPWEDDLQYARSVADRLSVPFEVVSLQEAYYERVVDYALAELRAGRTPSPDIFCNQRVKFGVFWERIADGARRFDAVATGHYARIERTEDRVLLKRAPDPVKDQTYFLSHLSREQLARAIFPVGDLHKQDVRQLAREWDLPNQERPDSQGICFLGTIRYPEFVRHYLGERPGDIVERATGRVLGGHRGYWFHTIGQRQGLGLGNGPWYVVGKDVERNVVFVAHADEVSKVAVSEFRVGSLTWINEAPARDTSLSLKLRHGPQTIGCRLHPDGNGTLRVVMETPDRGVAPGQFAVFYDGEVCLGSGRILEPALQRSLSPEIVTSSTPGSIG